MSDGLVIGVDIGGTKVAAGLVDASGKILCHSRNPMVADGTAARGLAAVMQAIDAASEQVKTAGENRRICSIGVCAPGPLDPKTGMVLNPPNVPCWRDFPLAAELAQLYRVQVKLDNDANAAGLAEAVWGAGAGYRNVFYFTLGTGIGTAILMQGRIYHGRTGAAGEGGHISIDHNGPRCNCGKRGCIEALASGPAIARRARAKIESGRKSAMLDLAGGKTEQISSEMVGKAEAAGDAVAHEVLMETIDLLAFWLGNIIDLLEPEVMVMGGGVGSMLTPFIGEIRERLPGCCLNRRCQEIPLIAAQFGEDAGILGGAALCLHVSSDNRAFCADRAE